MLAGDESGPVHTLSDTCHRLRLTRRLFAGNPSQWAHLGSNQKEPMPLRIAECRDVASEAGSRRTGRLVVSLRNGPVVLLRVALGVA